MKWIRSVVTLDGELHDSISCAERHVDKLYGDQLCYIARQLSKKDGKYTGIREWIDQHLDLFERLVTIKQDFTVEPKPEYWEE